MKSKLLCLLSASLTSLALAGTLQISRNGTTDFSIVLPTSPSLVEKTAARELASHLQAVTGAEFPVINEGQATSQSSIYVGATEALAKTFADIDVTKLGADSIVIESDDSNLYLAGHATRGTLYAVYTFLEDHVGIRWWTSTESTIPSKPSLEIPALHIRYTPKLFSRETHYMDARENVFAARLKNNGHFSCTTPEYGGHTSIIGFCHTFSQFMPASKYFDAHPEWFSLYNGERKGTDCLDYQLCLTNEEMTQEFIKICLQEIAKNPTAGIISVSQNDAYFCGACQCENCMKLVEENGSQSGPIIYFVNKVAEAIEKEYPDFLVDTLAYSYSTEPPSKIRPRDNVVIRLCLGLNDTQSIADGPAEIQAQTRAKIDKWAAISKHLYFWQYLAKYANYLLPHPTYGHYGDDIRYQVSKGAVGLFQQGDLYTTCGDFVRARAWIIAHLQWNPDLNERKLAEEFFNGYYGAAGPILLKYTDLLRDAAAKAGHSMVHNTSIPPNWISKSEVEEAYRLFDDALAKVKGNPMLTDRVRRERLPLDILALNWHIATVSKSKFQKAEASADDFQLPHAKQIAEEVVALYKKWDNQFIAEATLIGNYAQGLLDSLSDPKYIPEICMSMPKTHYDILPKNSMVLHGIGNWSEWRDDSAASDGRAATMPGNTPQWAIQTRIHDYPADQFWRACCLVRCEGDAEDGIGFNFGIHHDTPAAGSENVSCSIPLKDCKSDTYKLFMSEPFKPGTSGYFWICPPDRPLNEVKRVYVDQVFMIREGAPKVD